MEQCGRGEAHPNEGKEQVLGSLKSHHKMFVVYCLHFFWYSYQFLIVPEPLCFEDKNVCICCWLVCIFIRLLFLVFFFSINN